MKTNDYQKAAHEFAKYGTNEAYAYAGLAEEAGEVLGKYAKFIRKHQGLSPKHAKSWVSLEKDNEEYRVNIKKELGDVLWMVAEIATINDLSLEDIMQANIDKLLDRQNRGVIIGEGDNR
jgi:NTP pyrophosphatase (non-canonical NTP hydrolase)